MRRGRIAWGAATASALALALAATPAAGLEMNGGCTITLTSHDAGGATIDTAAGPGAGGTQADPFLIDWDGTVSWEGSSGSQVFMNHSWQTYVFLVPTPVRGGHPNEGEDTTGEGTAGVGENAPFRITGLYYVSGDINGEGGTHCDGSGWFKLVGEPTGTIPFFLALVLIAVGAGLMWLSRPTVIAGGRA